MSHPQEGEKKSVLTQLMKLGRDMGLAFLFFFSLFFFKKKKKKKQKGNIQSMKGHASHSWSSWSLIYLSFSSGLKICIFFIFMKLENLLQLCN